MPAEPSSVAELTARIHSDWDALQDVVSRLSTEEMIAPGADGWSIKDQLAHIAEWERACTAVLERRPQWEGFHLDPATYDGLDIDALNDILFQRHRADALAAVKDGAERAHADMLAAVSGLADADLARPVGEYGMSVNPERRLIEKIVGDTYAHYAEHAEWIRAALSQ